jgi:DNA modification methylase
VRIADARALSKRVTGPVDAIITSPPYLNAVDYYRRHQLEMYWLGLVQSQEERLNLLQRYIGRSSVNQAQYSAAGATINSRLFDEWADIVGGLSKERRRSFEHYCRSVGAALVSMAKLLDVQGRAVVVVGDSQIMGQSFPTARLFEQLAPPSMAVTEVLWYPIQNRYMSYARRNGADIGSEQAIVFQKRG